MDRGTGAKSKVRHVASVALGCMQHAWLTLRPAKRRPARRGLTPPWRAQLELCRPGPTRTHSPQAPHARYYSEPSRSSDQRYFVWRAVGVHCANDSHRCRESLPSLCARQRHSGPPNHCGHLRGLQLTPWLHLAAHDLPRRCHLDVGDNGCTWHGHVPRGKKIMGGSQCELAAQGSPEMRESRWMSGSMSSSSHRTTRALWCHSSSPV